jgi:Fic family protein
MGGGFFELDNELSTMLAAAHRQFGLLEGMTKFIPDIEITRDLMILKECYYSKLIDYDGDSILDMLKAINSGKNEVCDILYIISAYKHAFDKCDVAFSQLCTIALHGKNSKNTVREREKFAFLSRGRSNLKVYNPTAPDKIRSALLDLSEFLSNDDATDVLVKSALAHYQFEMIHPYECYNGIVGRIIFPMILYRQGIEAAPFIGLSEYLYFNKNDYSEILRTTQNSAGYIALIKFFVKGIHIAAKSASTQVEQLARIITEDKTTISAGNPAKSTIMVHDYFKKHLVSEIRPISEALGVSYNTVAKAIDCLISLGVLTKDGQRSRHRFFVYDRLLNTLIGSLTNARSNQNG